MDEIRFTSQKQTLPIQNHDSKVSIKQYQKHGDLLGGCKRGLIVGGSGCGKTNVIISLLEHPNGLRFENIYLWCKTLFQEKYNYLRKLLKPINGLGYYEYDESSQVIPPNEAKRNSVIIFDDVVCDSQSVIRDYYCFGRHKNNDCFYLAQTYSSIPKQLIRDNANFIVIFKQDTTNLKHIYDDHVNVDMTFEMFTKLCASCWKNQYGFMVIDKENKMASGRYRIGFDVFINIYKY